jgi:hypothetical protein
LTHPASIAANCHILAVRDAFPVSPGHTLVIARRQIASLFEATREENEQAWPMPVARIIGQRILEIVEGIRHVPAYWEIGLVIVEEEQNGKLRSDYGTYLLDELSRRLIAEFGKGFDRTNI